jgi:hypothetical protein
VDVAGIDGFSRKVVTGCRIEGWRTSERRNRRSRRLWSVGRNPVTSFQLRAKSSIQRLRSANT